MLSKKIITVIITAGLALSVGIGGTVLFFNSTDDSDKKDKDRTDTTSAEGGNADINDIIPGLLPDDTDSEETTAPANESTSSLSEEILGSWRDSADMSGYDFYEGGKFDWTYVNLTIGGKTINGKTSGAYTLEGDTLTLTYSIVTASITDVYTVSIVNNKLTIKNKENGNTFSYTRVVTAPSPEDEVYADPQLAGKWLDSNQAYGYEFKANGVVDIYLFVGSVEGYYTVDGDTVTIAYSLYGPEIGGTYTYAVKDNILTLTSSEGNVSTYIKQ